MPRLPSCSNLSLMVVNAPEPKKDLVLFLGDAC